MLLLYSGPPFQEWHCLAEGKLAANEGNVAKVPKICGLTQLRGLNNPNLRSEIFIAAQWPAKPMEAVMVNFCVNSASLSNLARSSNMHPDAAEKVFVGAVHLYNLLAVSKGD